MIRSVHHPAAGMPHGLMSRTPLHSSGSYEHAQRAARQLHLGRDVVDDERLDLLQVQHHHHRVEGGFDETVMKIKGRGGRIDGVA